MTEHTTRVRIPDLLRKKQSGQKITLLTAYDASMAHLLDRAGLDILLVGDSLGMVVMGEETTIGVTMDVMVHHTRAVVRGTKRALVVADMPFLTSHLAPDDALVAAGRLLQEGGAAAVKVEGGRHIAGTVRRLVEAGIPVMGHVGLMPQAVHQYGGYRTVGRTRLEADTLMTDAEALQEAGAFALVLECMPAALAKDMTAALGIPTLGIGAGPHCDGQVLVSYDAFGLYDGISPRFVKIFSPVGDQIVAAAQAFVSEVGKGTFPGPEHSFNGSPGGEGGK